MFSLFSSSIYSGILGISGPMTELIQTHPAHKTITGRQSSLNQSQELSGSDYSSNPVQGYNFHIQDFLLKNKGKVAIFNTVHSAGTLLLGIRLK